MIDKIKAEVLHIYNKLQNSDHEVYFVGGCVRNMIMGIPVGDWDLATNATPEQIQTIFPDSFYDNQFGTVGVPFEQNKNADDSNTYLKNYVEITTYRTEANYSDNRHPEKVEWGKSIEEDLSRRDFTMNAIAMGIKSATNELFFVDPYNGKIDITKKNILTVGKADERFKEDALRLLRAIRFAAQFGFSIEESTWKAIVIDSPLLSKISMERVRDELLKILASEAPYEGIELLDKSGLLYFILPELLEGKNISQSRPGRHHTNDVYTHNVLSLKFCSSKDPIVRLATLLHDIGKPYVQGFDENGLVTFYNHEVIGAKKAESIASRLRLSKKQREKIVTLIRWHMFTIDEHITDSAIRRFIRRVGVDNVSDMMDLRIGDRLGGGTQVAESWRLKKFKQRVEQQLNPPFSLNDMVVDGTDVMKELGIKPGPLVGKVLTKLFEEVDADLTKNNREYLLPRIHEIGNELHQEK